MGPERLEARALRQDRVNLLLLEGEGGYNNNCRLRICPGGEFFAVIAGLVENITGIFLTQKTRRGVGRYWLKLVAIA